MAKKKNKKFWAVSFFLLACVSGWFIEKIINRFLDKTIGDKVEVAIDYSLDEIDAMFRQSFTSMKNYLAKNTPQQIETKAENEDPEAQYNLGNMYYFGTGVAKDYNEAVKWYRKAAEQGLAQAQNNLGFMYNKGYGVAKDYNEAFKWWRKAAEQGDAKAQCNLGVMYDTGEGVAKDYNEAVKWFRKAAEQGHAQAQEALKEPGESW